MDIGASFAFPFRGQKWLRRLLVGSARIGCSPEPYLAAGAFAVATEVLAQFGVLLLPVGPFVTRFAARLMAVHAFAAAWRLMPDPAADAPRNRRG